MNSAATQPNGVFKSVCSLDCPDQCGLLVTKKTEKSLTFRETPITRSHQGIFATKSDTWLSVFMMRSA